MSMFGSGDFFMKFFECFNHEFSIFGGAEPNTVKPDSGPIWSVNHVNNRTTQLLDQFASNFVQSLSIISSVNSPNLFNSPNLVNSPNCYLFDLNFSSFELSKSRIKLKKSRNARCEIVCLITSFSVNDLRSSIKSVKIVSIKSEFLTQISIRLIVGSSFVNVNILYRYNRVYLG